MPLDEIILKLKAAFVQAWLALKAVMPLALAIAVFLFQNRQIILSAASLLI